MIKDFVISDMNYTRICKESNGPTSEGPRYHIQGLYSSEFQKVMKKAFLEEPLIRFLNLNKEILFTGRAKLSAPKW